MVAFFIKGSGPVYGRIQQYAEGSTGADFYRSVWRGIYRYRDNYSLDYCNRDHAGCV
ncbi:hypothetical protein D3C73_1293480 [compost metagenome]